MQVRTALHRSKSHGADAMAIESTDVYLFTTDKFKVLNKSDPATMYKIMQTIARHASKNVHSMDDKPVNLLIRS